MSRVNIEACAFVDPRFARLAQLLGLADADHARGRMAHLWLACTTRGEYALPLWLVEQLLGPGAGEALVAAELGRWSRGRGDTKNRLVEIRGTRGRTDWLARNKDQARKGGKTRAQNTSRVAGRFTSRVAGGVTSALTPALAPAPALAPEKIRDQTPKVPTGDVTQGKFGDLVERVNAAVGEVGTKPAEPVLARRRGRPPGAKPADATAAEQASVRTVLAKLAGHNGVRYSGTAEHSRLILRQLRDGVSEMDLRAVVGYCALELGWRDDEQMKKYLRPETLFGPVTIARYLDPARTWFSALPESATTSAKRADPERSEYAGAAWQEPAWMGGGS